MIRIGTCLVYIFSVLIAAFVKFHASDAFIRHAA